MHVISFPITKIALHKNTLKSDCITYFASLCVRQLICAKLIRQIAYTLLGWHTVQAKPDFSHTHASSFLICAASIESAVRGYLKCNSKDVSSGRRVKCLVCNATVVWNK